MSGEYLKCGLSVRRQVVGVGAERFLMDVPEPEDLLARTLQSESAASTDADLGSDPYWGVLWPASVATAALIPRVFSDSAEGRSMRILELGCGLGLCGLAVLRIGFSVTFTDIVPMAVELARHNAALNGFSGTEGAVLDWCRPIPAELMTPGKTIDKTSPSGFDRVIAGDVLYDVSLHQPLLKSFNALINANGRVIIGDPGRQAAAHFIESARCCGWQIDVYDEAYSVMPAPRCGGYQLLILTRAENSVTTADIQQQSLHHQ
ncbi:MAG: methyltransferase domain-containing protein [Planctomycetaceae bacterium]|nr:methyltransferase domain-containing protein [Planctomycetaceae bacterium]